MIRAKFIGADGSMGFHTGRKYWIRIEEDFYIWVRELFGRYCPYASMELLQQNWEIEKEKGEYRPARQYGRKEK